MCSAFATLRRRKPGPLTAFANEPVINDAVGARAVVLIGDTKTRSVRAYDRGDIAFAADKDAARLAGPGGDWKINEDALIGPAGDKLARVPGHISYWFAWDGYLGVDGDLYRPRNEAGRKP